MLLDANLLLYAVDLRSPRHKAAEEWLTAQLNGSRRIGFPWQSIGAFLRIATNPRAVDDSLDIATAWSRVQDWLATPVAWIPLPGPRHMSIFGDLLVRHDVSAGLVPDAQLAALALEHGLTVYSADTDFARFTEVSWTNPLA
jgi:uncharacterized protein